MLNVTSDYQNLSAEEIKNEYEKTCNKDAVMCLNVTGDMNIGMIVRTATIFQMQKVFLVGKSHFDKRTAVGMNHYITIEKISATCGNHNENLDLEKISNLLNSFEEQYTIIMVEQGGSPLKNLVFHLSAINNLNDNDNNNNLNNNKKPVLFVMGNEGSGIPDVLLKNRLVVSIPQNGIVRSFNVSNAFSIVAYEYYR